MKEEFNLSEKIVLEEAIKAFKDNTKTGWIHIFDVKEFIKRLKELICENGLKRDWDFSSEIDKLAGDDLK